MNFLLRLKAAWDEFRGEPQAVDVHQDSTGKVVAVVDHQLRLRDFTAIRICDDWAEKMRILYGRKAQDR